MSEDGAKPSDSEGHRLQSHWTIWFEKRRTGQAFEAPPPMESTDGGIKSDKGLSQRQYEQNLQKIGGFDTLESFWSYYSHLKRPSQLDAFSSYHVFRDETTPTWENYSQGGHWLVTMKKPVGQDDRLNRLWEQLLYALIGEEFEDPLVVGIVVQVRSKEDVLSVWLSDKAPKFRVGEKLKQILHLGPSTVIEYKNNASSIKDGTGIRNAQAYKIAEEKKKKQPEKTEKT